MLPITQMVLVILDLEVLDFVEMGAIGWILSVLEIEKETIDLL